MLTSPSCLQTGVLLLLLSTGFLRGTVAGWLAEWVHGYSQEFGLMWKVTTRMGLQVDNCTVWGGAVLVKMLVGGRTAENIGFAVHCLRPHGPPGVRMLAVSLSEPFLSSNAPPFTYNIAFIRHFSPHPILPGLQCCMNTILMERKPVFYTRHRFSQWYQEHSIFWNLPPLYHH